MRIVSLPVFLLLAGCAAQEQPREPEGEIGEDIELLAPLLELQTAELVIDCAEEVCTGTLEMAEPCIELRGVEALYLGNAGLLQVNLSCLAEDRKLWFTYYRSDAATGGLVGKLARIVIVRDGKTLKTVPVETKQDSGRSRSNPAAGRLRPAAYRSRC